VNGANDWQIVHDHGTLELACLAVSWRAGLVWELLGLGMRRPRELAMPSPMLATRLNMPFASSPRSARKLVTRLSCRAAAHENSITLALRLSHHNTSFFHQISSHHVISRQPCNKIQLNKRFCPKHRQGHHKVKKSYEVNEREGRMPRKTDNLYIIFFLMSICLVEWQGTQDILIL
jgi:hypothetical protein